MEGRGDMSIPRPLQMKSEDGAVLHTVWPSLSKEDPGQIEKLTPRMLPGPGSQEALESCRAAYHNIIIPVAQHFFRVLGIQCSQQKHLSRPDDLSLMSRTPWWKKSTVNYSLTHKCTVACMYRPTDYTK